MYRDRTHQAYHGRIVIMDFDKDAYSALITELKEHGFRVEQVSDPETVFNRMRTGEIDTLIIGVDVHDPNGAGRSIIPAIKRMNTLLPIIGTSNDDSFATASYVREQGVFYYETARYRGSIVCGRKRNGMEAAA
jgi:DNA-binding NtrC family response regulator